jgi:hypothetical protein
MVIALAVGAAMVYAAIRGVGPDSLFVGIYGGGGGLYVAALALCFWWGGGESEERNGAAPARIRSTKI